ncbi:MAG: formate dehydrogenase accessory sulfurtransferase FdhD [Bacteroidia bacterium]|nr:formate dehydrogenase accessory sulfurtransferase FdhD [Bacteroidia bacterium]MCZ2248883.1 formate dehydrogenase accessory sulfurtransferase FdhD [Bacteroidia bacterium]
MPLSIINKVITLISSGKVWQQDDLVAVEEPVELRLFYMDNNIPVEKPISITMRTPGNDFELAAGFILTEGIINNCSDIDYISYCIRTDKETENNIVKIVLKKEITVNINQAERNFFINGSCGICGKASINAIQQQSKFTSNHALKISHQQIKQYMRQMQSEQINFKYTGGIHACALFNQEGKMLLVREDIGRHNALDKLIGYYVLRNELPLQNNILLLSGRISFELVQKAVMAGISIVIGVGAPSSLAIDTAQQTGLTLIGFLKENSMNIYTHPERIDV